jgi:hypothetical protein
MDLSSSVLDMEAVAQVPSSAKEIFSLSLLLSFSTIMSIASHSGSTSVEALIVKSRGLINLQLEKEPGGAQFYTKELKSDLRTRKPVLLQFTLTRSIEKFKSTSQRQLTEPRVT